MITEVREEYVIHQLRSAMEGSDLKVLKRLEFGSYKISNGFSTEAEAIQTLVDEGMHYMDFVILKQVFITTTP